ncbi:MAG: exopolysaccharide biosynthesis polyprenyl glycosylphosphotransferase [Acidimicrobiales bacterium]
MSTPTIPHQALSTTGTLSVVPARPTRRAILSFPVESTTTRPTWAWLVASDGLVALLVLLIVSNLLPSLAPDRASITTNLTFVGISWCALAAAVLSKRVYSKARRHIAPAPADELATLESAIVIGALLTLALAAIFPALLHGALQPAATAIGFAGCAVVMPLARAAVIGVRARTATRAARVVVVGTGTIASDIGARLSRSRHIELVGFVDDDPVEGHPVLGDLESLPTICKLGMIDRVVIAFSRSHPSRTTDLLRSLVGTVAVDVVPRYFELTGWEASFQDLDGLAVVSLDGGPPGILGRLAKRVLDVVGSLAALLVVAPVLAAAALAIRLSSPGPVFFRQDRLGRNRREFRILKLRTMREPTPAEDAIDRSVPRPLTDLPEVELRVTAVGRLLRRLGVDELPQLFNVLLGEMSLVGPRPFVPEECSVLPEWVDRRFEIRPGITGLWQVCGQHDLRFEELCRLDCQYVASWSFAQDIRILARTPGRLLRGGGGAEG